MNTAWATALEVCDLRPGCVEVRCRLEDGDQATAIVYGRMCTTVSAGDRLLLNTTAVDLGLGTGGVHFVIANASMPSSRSAEPGHIMKLRYTPLQTNVLAVEEPDSPLHDALRQASSLARMPVVCCELLSQAPAVLAGLRHGGLSDVAVVATDDAGLAVPFCDLLARLRAVGLLSSVISAGQALGGDLEAVNVYSALLAARATGAEAAIVTPLPGAVGTDTAWGMSAVSQGQALNAAHSLEGTPVAVIRASEADPRTRHTGVSHHTTTVLSRVALCPFWAAWPAEADVSPFVALQAAVGERMSAAFPAGSSDALDAMERDWQPWESMGRSRRDDSVFFEAAAAAGILAARMQSERIEDSAGFS